MNKGLDEISELDSPPPPYHYLIVMQSKILRSFFGKNPVSTLNLFIKISEFGNLEGGGDVREGSQK